MNTWATETCTVIDEKLSEAREKDIRFFRVGEFKRNIGRVETFASACPFCQSRKTDITETAGKIGEAVNVPGNSRREYDRLIGRLSAHMQKEHGFYAPYYFTYLYSFLGMVAGLVLGYILLKLFPAYNWAMLSLGFALAFVAGYFWGHAKDTKIRQEKRLM